MSLVCDPVAAQLYPSDAPSTHQPVAVEGDGNCFFRAASVTLTGCEKDHVKLRRNVMYVSSWKSKLKLLRPPYYHCPCKTMTNFN